MLMRSAHACVRRMGVRRELVGLGFSLAFIVLSQLCKRVAILLVSYCC